MNAPSNFSLGLSQELKCSGSPGDQRRIATSLKSSERGRKDMSTFSFTLTLLLLGTIGAAQSDNPVFWLLIGPAPFAVMFTGLVFLRQQFSPKRMGKPLRHLESLEGARHGRVSALMIAIKAQAVGDDDSSLA
jgi:hypothetical protein